MKILIINKHQKGDEMLTEIFCLVDDFCKEFDQELSKKSVSSNGSNRKFRSSRLSRSEIITILIFFHLSKYRTFKDYQQAHLWPQNLQRRCKTRQIINRLVLWFQTSFYNRCTRKHCKLYGYSGKCQ